MTSEQDLTRKIKKVIKPYNFFYYLGRKTYLRLVKDEIYLKYAFKVYLGYDLNLNNPVTINEKIQWLKLNDRKDYYSQLVDKYAVRKYVAERIGEKYLNELYGVYQKFEDIDFKELPDQFVIKCTHDSGSVYICKSKQKFDFKHTKKNIHKAMKKNFYWMGREYAYKNVTPRIIVEKYIEDGLGKGLRDYKVFCFNGEPKFIQVDFDRFTNHRRNIYSINWEYMGFTSLYPTDPAKKIEKPECLSEMLVCAKKLAKDIPFLRTDFYVVDDKIIFGELTLYHGCGFERYYPQEWDKKLGEYLKLGV